MRLLDPDSVTAEEEEAVLAGLCAVEAHAPGGEVTAWYHDEPVWWYQGRNDSRVIRVVLLLDKGVEVAEIMVRDGTDVILSRLSLDHLSDLGRNCIALWDGLDG